MPLNYKTTADIKISPKINTQVIGQEEGLNIIKKASKQRRNVLLIGEPGTGKSMLGQGLAELLSKEKLIDILCFHNEQDENNPLVRTMPRGKGKELVTKLKTQSHSTAKGQNILFFVLLIITIVTPWWIRKYYGDIMAAASLIGSMIFLGAFILFINLSRRMGTQKIRIPKLLIDNSEQEIAPFQDATGSKAGALFGDVLHDPLQCIPGDQLIHLPNGKPITISNLVDPLLEEGIKELKNNEIFKILAGTDSHYCYNPAKVTKIFKRKYHGEIVSIKTRRGYTIKVTPNHPIAILNGEGVIEYLEASKITSNTKIISPYRLPNYVKAKANNNFLKLLGYILADGHIHERSIVFKVRREFKINEITKVIKENGLKPTINIYGKNTIININSASFIRKLLSMGIKKNGKKAMPPFIYDLPQDQIMQFISSYFSLDGHVNKQGQFELFSKEMIPDIVPLLLKIGIRAKVKQRLDPGFGKGKLQDFILFNNFEFAKEYFKLTVNPTHIKNSSIYLKETNKTHVTFDEELPLSFEFLESIRNKTGLSQNKVHKEYYSLKPNIKSSKLLTRGYLRNIVNTFLAITNGPELFRLKNLSEGSYSCDEIIDINIILFEGYVYNLTTETGNFLVNNILTHNSGGLGTPAYERVSAGMVHKANGGVLFIDEIGLLDYHSQQELLTAMQEKKFKITGQSERSSGAMVATEAAPADFILVAAGNLETIEKMHPALRSRIRGYGYEVYMNDTMPDTPENRDKIAIFVAQEVTKDKKIPHFEKEAVEEIIKEGRKMAGIGGKLTVRLRELGGIVRAAGDLAIEENAKIVTNKHVINAKSFARPLEQQLSDKYLENKKKYEVIKTTGSIIGRVNGLAVMGSGAALSGLVLPIESQVTAGGKKAEFIATGKLGEIAKEAVKNVSAIILKYFGTDIKEKNDVYIQFLQTASSGVEGDSASIAVATAVISALKDIPVRQDTAMTGSLSIRGEVLAIGGVTAKVEAAIEAGIKQVIVPKANFDDLVLTKDQSEKVKIIPVISIEEVLKNALVWKGKESILNKFKK